MSTANLDSADLKAVATGGLISESVMADIWDISQIPLMFSDSIGSGTADNSFHEWTKDALQTPDDDNATVDGADAGTDDSNTGERVGNRCQIPDKVLRVSDRARNSSTIGFADTLEYQLMMRQQEIFRDLEVIYLRPQASVADNGDAVPGRLGGFPSWLTTNTDRGVGGLDGGYDAGTVDAPTAGTARAITEEQIRDMSAAVYDQGGNPTIGMSTTAVIRRVSEYMFTASARIATLQRNEQGSGAATAVGAVNVFITDFGVTLELRGNRLMKEYDTARTNFFIYDPAFVSKAFLQGVQVKDIARTGTAENRQMTADATLVVGAEEAHAVIADIDGSLPMTAS